MCIFVICKKELNAWIKQQRLYKKSIKVIFNAKKVKCCVEKHNLSENIKFKRLSVHVELSLAWRDSLYLSLALYHLYYTGPGFKESGLLGFGKWLFMRFKFSFLSSNNFSITPYIVFALLTVAAAIFIALSRTLRR